MKIDYHEQVTIVMNAAQKWDRRLLNAFLIQRGFVSEDDFYELSRNDRCEAWQSSSIMDVNVFLEGECVYETQADVDDGISTMWDELRCDYLLATLPRDCISIFVCELEALQNRFELTISFEGKTTDVISLCQRLNDLADALSQEWDAPGSETMRILVEEQYPR